MPDDKKDLIEPIDASFDAVVGAVVPRAAPQHSPPDDSVIHEVEFVEYSDPGNHNAISFALDPGTETIWATEAQIAELFQTDVSGVSRHLKKIFDEEELSPAEQFAKNANCWINKARHALQS